MRKVDELVKVLGLDGISKSQVSRMCQEFDTVVEPFRTRQLTEEYPYIWVDATYHKVRVDGRVVSQATVRPCSFAGTRPSSIRSFAYFHA